MNDAIRSYNLLRQYLIETKQIPYHHAEMPIQWQEGEYGYDKKSKEDIVKEIDECILRVTELIKRAKVEDPWKTGLLWSTVFENAEWLAWLIHILNDKTPLPPKPKEIEN